AHGAQTANEERGTDLTREVHEQPAEPVHLDAWLVPHGRTDESYPFVDREQRRLGGVDRDRDHEPVDVFKAAVHEIFVAPGDGIEAPGVDGDSRVRHAGNVRGAGSETTLCGTAEVQGERWTVSEWSS